MATPEKAAASMDSAGGVSPADGKAADGAAAAAAAAGGGTGAEALAAAAAAAGPRPPPPPKVKLYDAAEYKDLDVTKETRDLFDYIGRYAPKDIQLPTKMRPFIPDFLPAVTVDGVDRFLKVGRPDGLPERMGISELDEPNPIQTDPALAIPQIFDHLRPKNKAHVKVPVPNVEHANRNPKKLTAWVQAVAEANRKQPPTAVVYAKPMPDIDTLMQAWPQDIEQLLKSTPVPGAALGLPIEEYVRVVCAMLDIPVYPGKTVESLHLLFTLFAEFKQNAAFANVNV